MSKSSKDGATQAGLYDYIVVGAGSAGCVLANRLTEDGSSVLLLEAGSWDRDPLIHLPLGIGKIFPERLHDWGYFMEPDPGLDGRSIECARGKVVGGSSSVNVMAYVRGHRADYDRWAANGLSGWSYDDVLPYFRRSEHWEGGADAYRGGSGPLRTQRTRYQDPILDAFIAAGREAGFEVTQDYNAAIPEGFGLLQSTIHRGRRASAASAYLRPALRRPGLSVSVGSFVIGIDIDHHKAVGVRFCRNGDVLAAQARREIILSAGVIDTPKILMLSGIGDPHELERHGISVRVASPSVGRNLRDHLSVLVQHRRRDPSPFQRSMRYDRLAFSMARAWLTGGGFAADVPIGVTAFLKTEPNYTLADVQLLFLAAPFPARPYLPPFSSPVPDAFGCRVALLRPESSGRVSLASSNPMDKPKIVPNFLSTPNDRVALRRGVSLTRHIMAQSAIASHTSVESAPGPLVRDDDDLDAFIRRTAVTVHHPAGTCRMGSLKDMNRVVDAELRVCGIDSLRVVDASVLPDMVGGNINAVIMMIAEKASDLIRGLPPIPRTKPADFNLFAKDNANVLA
jgi:4-pyridoxate dehydrogenase